MASYSEETFGIEVDSNEENRNTEIDTDLGSPYAEPSYSRTPRALENFEVAARATVDEIMAPNGLIGNFAQPAKMALDDNVKGFFAAIVAHKSGIPGPAPVAIAKSAGEMKAILQSQSDLGLHRPRAFKAESLKDAKEILRRTSHMRECPHDTVFTNFEDFTPICNRPGFVPNTAVAHTLEHRDSAHNKGSWTVPEYLSSDHHIPAPSPSEFEPAKTAVVCGFSPKQLFPASQEAQYSRNGYFRAFSDLETECINLAARGITSFVATEEQGAGQLGFWAADSAKRNFEAKASTVLALPWANRGSLFNDSSPVFSRADMNCALAAADSVISFSQNDSAANALFNCVPTEGVDAPAYGEGLGKDQFAEVNANRNNWIAENCGHAICATLHGVAVVSALPGQTLKPLDGSSLATMAQALDFAVAHDITTPEQAAAFMPANKHDARDLKNFIALASSTSIGKASAKLCSEKLERNGAEAYGFHGTVCAKEYYEVFMEERFKETKTVRVKRAAPKCSVTNSSR